MDAPCSAGASGMVASRRERYNRFRDFNYLGGDYLEREILTDLCLSRERATSRERVISRERELLESF